MVCWQLIRGPVHPKNPVSIVAGLIILQTPILLSIQRSWLNFVPVVLLVVVVLRPLLEVQVLLEPFLLLLPQLSVLLRLGCLIVEPPFM